MKLKFPEWVPPLVQEFAVCAIFGTEGGGLGLQEWRRQAELKGEISDARELHEDELCVLRLAGIEDDRMEDAYIHLSNAALRPTEILAFIESARAMRVDYSQVRQHIAAREEFAARVNRLALDLAETLERGLPDLKVRRELESNSIRSLLRRSRPAYANLMAKTCEMRGLSHGWGESIDTWRKNWELVLGNFRQEEGQPGLKLAELWRSAPTLTDCLRTLADDFRPDYRILHGPEEFAINRQENPVTAYLRAFGWALIEPYDESGEPVVRKLSSPLLKAIATTATVVLNVPDIDITAKDVKQALTVGGITDELKDT